MTLLRQDKHVLAVGIIVLILCSILLLGWGGLVMEKAYAQTKTDVIIELEEGYELSYKMGDYLADGHPDAQLFGVLKISDAQTLAPIGDIDSTDITITNQTSILNAGTYQLIFSIEHEDYQIWSKQPVVELNIQKAELSPESHRFIGINPIKTYDSTVDMKGYEMIVFIDGNYESALDFLAQNIETEYSISYQDSVAFLESNTAFCQNGDAYLIIRIDYERALTSLFLSLENNGQKANEVLDGFMENIESWLSGSFDFEIFVAEQIKNLYFTDLGELIELEGAGYVYGHYLTKHAESEKSYEIYFEEFVHSNYQFDADSVTGQDGFVDKAVLALQFAEITGTYGEPLPYSYQVDFLTQDFFNQMTGLYPAQVDGIYFTLPHIVRGTYDYATFQNHLYYHKLLTDFYPNDISEVTEFYNDERFVMPFQLQDIGIEYPDPLNVYLSHDMIAQGRTKYPLMPLQEIDNYRIVDPTNLYNPENVMGLNIMPLFSLFAKDLNIDGIDIEFHKEYNSLADASVTAQASTTDFIIGQDALFELIVKAKFLAPDMSEQPNAHNDLFIGDLEIELKPVYGHQGGFTDDELDLMTYNYNIVIESFLDKLNTYSSDTVLEVYINSLAEWISYDEYLSDHSGEGIIDYRLAGINEDVIKINPTQMTISPVPNQQMIYGNDIMLGFEYLYQNFYQDNPESIFKVYYRLEYESGDLVYEGLNSEPTQLLPQFTYYLIIKSWEVIDSEWENYFGLNYNIEISSDRMPFEVIKGQLSFEVADAEKFYGDLDPEFSFKSISGARDSDIDSLISLLARTADTSLFENVGEYIEIELNTHPYYDFALAANGQLVISKRTVLIEPIEFEVEYGVADYYTKQFTVTKGYTVGGFPAFPSQTFEIDVLHNCLLYDLNCSDSYSHSVLDAQLIGTHSENLHAELINGDNKIKIIPKEIQADLSVQGGDNTAYLRLLKTYDNEALRFSLKDPEFDYGLDLIGEYDPLTPYQRAVNAANVDIELPYGEKIFYADIAGYQDFSEEDAYQTVRVGYKKIFIEYIVIASKISGFAEQRPDQNYIFVVPSECRGEITQRDFQVNTKPLGSESYIKTYDGMPYRLPFSSSMTGQGLLSGHYILPSSLWFESVSASVGRNIALTAVTSELIILDQDEHDVTENYNLATTDFNQADIEKRIINVSIEGGNIQYGYDGTRIYIDLSSGMVYRHIPDGEDTPVLEYSLIFTYSYNNYNQENSLETVFVEDHIVFGSFITAHSNAGTNIPLNIVHEVIRILDGEDIDYAENYTLVSTIGANVQKRPILIDIFPLEEPEYIYETTYNGEIVMIEVSSDFEPSMIVDGSLVEGHSLWGYRGTADPDVRLIDMQAAPKDFSTNYDLTVTDPSLNNLTANYQIDFVNRKAIIYPITLTIDIYNDTSFPKEKHYDGMPFDIEVTDEMDIENKLIDGEKISGGLLSTWDELSQSWDANVYTLNEYGEIVYDEFGDYIPKELRIFLDIYITKADGADSSNNYQIALQNNYVKILPKLVDIVMQNQYSMQAVYKGEVHAFPITDAMVTEHNQPLVNGLVGLHTVSQDSQPLLASEINAGENIEIIYPVDQIYIQDEVGSALATHNYSFNYLEAYIDILKRPIQIDVSLSEYDLFKTYDTFEYRIELNNSMDADKDTLEAGLVRTVDFMHNLTGNAYTQDEFVASQKPLLYENVKILHNSSEDVTDNYDISFAYVTVAINKKVVDINLNVELEDGWLKKVYDEQKLEVILTPNMLTGLEGMDYLGDGSFVRTNGVDFGIYDMGLQGEAQIIINREGVEGNLASNYSFVYPFDGGKVEIQKRNITISVRHSDLWHRDEYLISGLNGMYFDNYFTVDFRNYYIDLFDNDTNGLGFELVAGHFFADGSRITSDKNVGERILLEDYQNALIFNSAEDDVTDNYDISYEDSYFEIYKRKIFLDVARDQTGDTSAYDENNSFIKPYDRRVFEIGLHTQMSIEKEEYPLIVQGHTIVGGSLVSEDSFVSRNALNEVISKPLIWGSDIVILDNQGEVVTNNYDIDFETTEQNFEQRFVTILPQTIVIDILKGVPPHTKPYDGQPFQLTIINSMVVDLYETDGKLVSGFMGDLNQSGVLINRDIIRPSSGYLITQTPDVAFDEGNVTHKPLVVGKDIVIENPNQEDVTVNYDIYYYQNVYNLGTWYNIVDRYPDYETHLPVAVITLKDLTLTLINYSHSDEYKTKIQKYYDGQPLDILVGFQNGEVLLEDGAIINDNLSDLVSLSGLVSGEYACYRLYTSDGNVAQYKNWNYQAVEILNKDGESSLTNYNLRYQRESFAQIRPRQIVVDVNTGAEMPKHVYDADYYRVELTNDMIVKNADNNRVLDIFDSLGLLEGHNITSGIRRSESRDVGIHRLVPDTLITIYNQLGQDVTNQYIIFDGQNQLVEIIPAQLIIDLDHNPEIQRQKVYDGQPFVIPLNYPNIVQGLKSPDHYVAQGLITTLDKSAGEDKQTVCDFETIIINQEQTGIHLDVTRNYEFVYVPRTLTILQKGIRIFNHSPYYKSYNNTTTINLQEKHYRFGEGDIIPGDIVKLISYNAEFSSPMPGGTGETITVSDCVIDNENYYLIEKSFTITGHIVEYTPQVSVEDNKPIEGTKGVIFVYDSLPKTATYTVSGLDGVNVKHSVKYQVFGAPEGEYMTSLPTEAGLYKMILETQDEDYPYWQGDVIMIQINPAEVNITFLGSQNQIYGAVTDITARAQGAGGLNQSIQIDIVPNATGYTYPEAGEYTIHASFNTELNNPNYLPREVQIPLTIQKRTITVEYGESDFVYDGTYKTVQVSIRSGEILPQDLETVTDNSLIVTYSPQSVKSAGEYQMNVDIDSNNYQITNNSHSFVIAKKDLIIMALINSSTRAILNEGDKFVATIEYSGFVSGENREYLQKPAFLPYVPKTAITEMEIMPFGAESQNYRFEYVPAYITIIPRKVSEIESSNGLAVVLGEFGSYTTLNAKLIEANISNPDFYLLNEKLKNSFSGTDFLSEYKAELAYRLQLGGEEPIGSTQIKLRLPANMQSKKNLVVVHFGEGGSYELLPAYREGEFLVLNADGLGDLVIMASKPGLNRTTTILLFIAPVALFGLVLLFYMLFRRKYD